MVVFVFFCVWADSVCSYLHSTQLCMTRVIYDVLGGFEGSTHGMFQLLHVRCEEKLKPPYSG
jgi:hypothetical protein